MIPDLALCRRLLRETRPHGFQLLGLFLLSVLAAPLALLGPLPLKLAVDSVLGDHPLPAPLAAVVPRAVQGDPGHLLWVVVALVVLIALLTRLQAMGTWVFQTYLGQRLVLRFRARILRHLQRLSMRYHDSKGTADSVYRLQYDALAVQQVAIEGVIPLATSILKIGAMAWVILLIDVHLALVAFTVAPLLLGVTHLYRGRLRSRWTTVKERDSEALSVVQESLSSLRVVKAFGAEERELDRYASRAHQGLRAHMRAIASESGLSLAVGTLMAGGTAAVLLVGVNGVRSGALTLGSLLMVMGYLAQLYEPIRLVGRKVAALQRALASAERVFATLDQAPDVDERPQARPLERARGHVTFRNVSFGYEPGRRVLRELSFDVAPGSRVAVAGPSGIGKTTLVSLLPRLFDPDGGAILLDGVDLREYRLRDLRRQFSLVLQEPVLFSASIGENIAYGRPGASHDEIVAAAAAANAHGFIEGLPRGYGTQVGERGMQLSGGERQRVAVARAFLRDAPILVLDEPTSSVDRETEGAIMEALERLMKGRTTFIIAHRESTLETCDVRIDLERGRVHGPAGALTRSHGQAT